MLNFFKSKSKSNSKLGASSGAMAVVDVTDGSGPAPGPEAMDLVMPSELPKVCLEDFDLLKVLGKGGFGKVMLVRKKGTDDIYAMKVLKKEAVIRRNQVAHTKTETHILKQIRHPFLTRMYFGAPPPLGRPRPFAAIGW